MKIQKSIWYVLLLVLGGFIYLVLFTYQSAEQNKESFQWVNHTHEVIENIHAVHSALLDAESRTRGFVISGNEVFSHDSPVRNEVLISGIRRLQALTTDNPGQHESAQALLLLARKKNAFQTGLLQTYLSSPQKAQQLVSGLTGKKLTDSMEAVLQKMQRVESNLLTVRMEKHDHFNRLRYTTTIVITSGAFLLLSVLLLGIGKEARLRQLAEQKAITSKQQYKGLIENLAVVVHSTDLEGNFTYLSGKCKEFTGFTAEELVGEHFLMVVEESWREKVQAFYESQIEKQIVETVLELPVVSKNGELRWIEQSTVLLQKGGQPTGFQSIAKDITERKYAEKLLADSEQRLKAKQDEYQERLQAILDNMPMIIYLKDLQGHFIMVNRKFHQTFGTTDEEVIGKTEIKAHKNEESARPFDVADNEVKRTRKPVEVEGSVLTTEGERNMLIVKFPLFDKQNELFAISAVGKDITEVIRYQRQLIKARKRAERAERLQEEFLANMSHEIRTPMNGIIGMTNLMETTALNNEQRDYLRLIKESSDILLSLINDILDLSKIKSGRMSVETIDYNLHQTIDSIIAPFKVKGNEKGIQINKIFQGVPQYIRGDQHKLQQVLNNLLSNAVKFTAKGTVSLFATTEKRAGDSLFLICTISDTGMGISPDNLEQIFESFVQAGNDMVRRYGGTGLGLAITKRLIELQGGKISVSSTLGEGTSFYVELPLLLGNNSNNQPSVTTVTEEGTTTSLQGKKILLIEDNLVNQKVTCLMLQKAGMRVHIANHGKEAIELLKAGSYDLIITDLQMPEMDGFQTAAYIRNKMHLSVPMIAMTASALRNEKDRCLQLGMNEYLTKPFAPASLFFHLKRLLTEDEKKTEAGASLPEESREELYNLSYLAEMEDNDYTAEVLSLFLSTTPETLLQVKESSFQEEWGDVYKKAHSLKSSLGILQMSPLLQTITEIETAARNTVNTDTIEPLVQQAMQQYNLVRPMLEAELESSRKKNLL